MSKHTPGPWQVKANEVAFLIVGADGIRVLSTSWHSSIRERYPLKAEAKANAILAAAAPDLLDATKEGRTDLMIAADNARHAAKTDPRWEGVAGKLMERVAMMDAAIAKAEGA